LLDLWESTSGLNDPDGNPLPDIHAMGADSLHMDLFIEVGYLQTLGYTTDSQGSVPPHSHRPSEAVINMLGDALKNAPVTNPDGSTGINLHVDIGASYQGNPYVISSTTLDTTGNTLAQGGDAIGESCGTDEAPCVSESEPFDKDAFPDYPGTIAWKKVYQYLRDQPLNYPGRSPVPGRQKVPRANGVSI